MDVWHNFLLIVFVVAGVKARGILGRRRHGRIPAASNTADYVSLCAVVGLVITIIFRIHATEQSYDELA